MRILCSGISSVARSGDRGSLAGGGTIRGPAARAGLPGALRDRDARACGSPLRCSATGSETWGQCVPLRIGAGRLPLPSSAGWGGTRAWAIALARVAYAWPSPRIDLDPHHKPAPQSGVFYGADGGFAAGG